jgi:hypothetical protein
MNYTPGGALDFWENTVRPKCGKGGQFYLDIAKRLGHSRFVSRNNGEWSLPWQQALIPGFEMPAYDPTFAKSFAQVSDERALEMRDLIRAGEKLAIMYSGGMDSTVVVVALLKNLTPEELESVAIVTSVHAVIENPDFWGKYIQGKFKIIDSLNNWYDDIIAMGYRPVTADEGDCIMGTSIGLQLYHNYDVYISELDPATRANLSSLRYKISSGDVHYSVYRDIIIRHLAYDQTPAGKEFGRLLYEKYAHNANTASVPIHSLHDFFWWLIFNVKYLNCSVRSSLFYNNALPVRQCIDTIVNWFNGADYQRWSMANNNNGSKIRDTLATYKYDARKYIYDFDNNEWYFHFKTKLESLINLMYKGRDHARNGSYMIGLDTNYQHLPYSDPSVEEYFTTHLMNYRIDWTD